MTEDLGVSRKWSELTGEDIVELLYFKSGMTCQELTEAVSHTYGQYASGMPLYNAVRSLLRSKMLIIDGAPKDFDDRRLMDYFFHGPHERPSDSKMPAPLPVLRASDEWNDYRVAMRQIWAGAKSRASDFHMTVFPDFGAPARHPRPDVFVMMPFADKYTNMYERNIKPAIEKLNLTVLRGDEIVSARQIMKDVWTSIVGCGVVVAECSERNANVFYELGIAHAVGKPTVLLLDQASEMPFDLAHIRYYEYSAHDLLTDGFGSMLSKAVKEILQLTEY